MACIEEKRSKGEPRKGKKKEKKEAERRKEVVEKHA